MIGSTNGKLAYSTVDKVSITLLTDDNAHDKLMGVIVTVSYDDKSTEYIWDGKTIKVKIPTYSEYSISVSSVTGYVTPTVFTAIAQLNGETAVDLVYCSAVDLSRVDIYGNPIAQNTANCYIIKEVGTYEFPIAYGAAIKNDEINTSAFTNSGLADNHDFVNYLGNAITSPYIEIDTATQATEVQISIADTDNILSELQLREKTNCRYVQFKINSVPITGANLVLSVKDASGVIMWSWHIWVWSDDLTPIEITNASNVKYNILPYNLGSKWDEDSKEHIKNWNYQFGRPVPILCSSAHNSTSNHISYGVLDFISAPIASSLYKSIQNPTTFYLQDPNNGYLRNWFQEGSDKIRNLWDAMGNTIGGGDNNTVKTVYDPCPVGFKIPNGNTFTYFIESNVISRNNHIICFKKNNLDTTGIVFIGTNFRNNNLGTIILASNHGAFMVWLSSTLENYPQAFSVFEGTVSPYSRNVGAAGLSVRPVKDEDLALPTHKLTINVSADNSVLPSGFEIKVYQVIQSTDATTGEVTETLGNVLATQTTASATHEITWGTIYRIVANDCTGYTTPSNQSFVASQPSRNVDMVYEEEKFGVFIYDIDGKLTYPAVWNTANNSKAVGVAIVTDNCRFVVAKEDIGEKSWGGYGADLQKMTNYTRESTAATDFDGVNNTSKIIEVLGSDSAAGDCAAYTFPNGQPGYLGASGEWQVARQNKDALNSALMLIRGTKMTEDIYWTSTECDGNDAWYQKFDSANYLMSYAKISKFYVRAFSSC